MKRRIPVEEDVAEAPADVSPAAAAAPDQGENGKPVNKKAASSENGRQSGKGGSVRKRRLGRSDRGEEEKKALLAECDALSDRYLRLQADFENFRKRVLREKDDLYRRANEDIVLDMLPVLDHLELAMESAESHDVARAFVEGFQLVCEQFLAVLKKSGVDRVADSSGPFDPRCHEAVSHLPSDDVPADHIMARVRKGYVLGDRLLRAAQVVVSSGPAGGGQDGG